MDEVNDLKISGFIELKNNDLLLWYSKIIKIIKN